MGTPSPSVLIVGCAGKAVPRKMLRLYSTVWAINRCFECAKVNPNLVIAIDDFKRDEKAEPGYVDGLFGGHSANVMTTIAYSKWPRSRNYPLASVMKELHLDRRVAERLFDNSCNYAMALAIANGMKAIGLHGIAFTNSLSEKAWNRIGRDDWIGTQYKGKLRPEWFKYHGKIALYTRRPTEPGTEAFHFLLGLAIARGIKVEAHDTTLLNLDRKQYFYGYQVQPNV